MKAFLFMLCLAVSSGGWLRGALSLSGASSEEELSAAEMERYSSLASRPLDLNSSSRPKLESSGLLSPYQIAVLLDARSSGGDICSYTELASLDGFGMEFVEALRPFVTLDGASLSGPPGRRGFSVDGLVRAQVKDSGFSTSCKLNASYSDILDASLSVSGTSLCGFSLNLSPRRSPLSIIAGDYYARFGQGLVLWNGFSLSGVGSPESIRRTPYGITPCNSFSPGSHMRGLAVSYAPGRLVISASYDVGGCAVGALSYSSNRSTFGLTFLSSGTSLCVGVDAVSTIGKATLFAEAALDLRSLMPAAVAGGCWNAGYRRSLTFALRCYPYDFSNEYSSPLKTFSSPRGETGFSAGWKHGKLELTMDVSDNRYKEKSSLKSSLVFNPEFKFGELSVSPYIKAVARYRPQDKCPLRLECRTEISAGYCGFVSHIRSDVVNCSGISYHAYAELGYRNSFTLFVRASIFKVDDWNDRIYVYERDVPGAFNVPARYGRGFSLAAYASYRGLSCRVAAVRYPWSEGRDDVTELRLQWNFDSQKVKRRPRPRAGA